VRYGGNSLPATVTASSALLDMAVLDTHVSSEHFLCTSALSHPPRALPLLRSPSATTPAGQRTRPTLDRLSFTARGILIECGTRQMPNSQEEP
jgi:hypothetical protein